MLCDAVDVFDRHAWVPQGSLASYHIMKGRTVLYRECSWGKASGRDVCSDVKNVEKHEKPSKKYNSKNVEKREKTCNSFNIHNIIIWYFRI